MQHSIIGKNLSIIGRSLFITQTVYSVSLFQIMISTIDGLSRIFQTNFTIEIQPLNDNAPYIRLFTIPSSCSYNSSSGITVKRRSVSSIVQRSNQVNKREQIISPHDQMMVSKYSTCWVVVEIDGRYICMHGYQCWW